jgi:hypothetical protein
VDDGHRHSPGDIIDWGGLTIVVDDGTAAVA